ASAPASATWRISTFRAFAVRSPRAATLVGAVLVAGFSTAWLLLQSPNFFSGYDFMRMHFFYKSYFRDAVLAGRLPLWNPYVGLGRPFMADIETATLYPPNLLVLAFGVYGGLAMSVLLHQALAIYGGVRLGGILGAGSGASWLVGAGIAVASPFTSRLDVGIIEGYFSLCWLPVLLWLGARLQDRWEPRVAAGFAAAVGLTILAGQPPLAYVEFCGLLVFLACRQAWPAARNLAGLCLAGAIGVGLACAQLLPFLELVGEGNRPLNARGFAIANGMPAPSWLSLIVPTSAAFGPNWEYDVHCGLVPLFAALGGIFLWRDRNVRALLGLGLVGALLAAGDRAPALGWATHFLPGAAALRIPSRYGILFATALLGLGAVALSRRPPRPVATLLVGLAVCVGWVVWLEPHVVAGTDGSAGYYASRISALCGAALLVGLWHERARWPRLAGPLGPVLGLFCAANWLWAIHLQAPVYSQYGFHDADSSVRADLERAGLLSDGGAPPRVSFNAADVRENAGMVQGFGAYNSYVAPSLRRTWGYLHAATGVPMSASDFIRLPQAVVERSDRLGGINLVAAYDRASRSLVVRTDPDPRAYVAFGAEIFPDWVAAEGRMASLRGYHETALVEAGSAPDFSPAPGIHKGSASIASFEPERVVVRSSTGAPGILVLAEAWYPGWQATVGGRTSEVFPVNGWMRGVVVPAGDSEVVFSFRPRMLAAGLGISLASAAAILALLLRRPGQTDSRIL
ncbi:MAG TPA: hypothetical protein VN877_00695, partial [Opitutaceae bacterium]|nr:hypothetical protein [Opitutaceae bacterium]